MSEQLTGRALDRAIAELLGWSVYSYMEASVDYYMAVAPHDGEYSIEDYKWLISLGGQYAKRKTEAEAWADCTDYHADANATLAVCAERGWYLSFTGNTALIAYPIGGDFARTHRGDGTTPQEAGARALLAALTATADR